MPPASATATARRGEGDRAHRGLAGWAPCIDEVGELASESCRPFLPAGIFRSRQELATPERPRDRLQRDVCLIRPPRQTSHAFFEARSSGCPSVTLIWSAACQPGRGPSAPLVCGFGFGGGSAPAVVDVCVATHMRGLVPHDRVCEMRSGADLWRRAWPRMRLLTAFSRVAPRVGSPCALLAEPFGVAATPSLRAPSSVRRARARRRLRRSGVACLGPRARSSVHAACRALESAWARTVSDLPVRLRSSVMLKPGGALR